MSHATNSTSVRRFQAVMPPIGLLKTKQTETLTEKIALPLIKLATVLIVPATLHSKESVEKTSAQFDLFWANNNYQKYFQQIPIEVITPDGAILQGTYFRHCQCSENSHTVILFQPNAAIRKNFVFGWLFKKSVELKKPVNFIYFDYRGCDGTDQVPTSAISLYLDGESIYQFARNELKVPPQRIHFYGWSLGGAVSAAVKAMNQECTGRYVNDRSFTCLTDAIRNIIECPQILAYIACQLAAALKWDMNPAAALEMLKGKTLIVAHPRDELMHGRASLSAHVENNRHFVNNERVMKERFLDITTLDLWEGYEYVGTDYDNHNADLDDFEKEGTKTKASVPVAEFLFADIPRAVNVDTRLAFENNRQLAVEKQNASPSSQEAIKAIPAGKTLQRS